MVSAFEVSASFGQISLVAEGNKELPFWRSEHLAQGFAKRAEAVSFGLPEHEGSLWVEISIADQSAGCPNDALRAIEVPFDSGSSRICLVGWEGFLPLDVPPGSYAVRFILLPGKAVSGNWMTYVVSLQFIPGAVTEARLLVRDAEMMATDLVLTAEPPEKR